MNTIVLHFKNFLYAERKPLVTVAKELVQYSFYEKEFPMYYFMNLLYSPEVNNIKNYAGGRKFNFIVNTYQNNNNYLDNKLSFFHFMKQFSFRTPEVFGYSKNGDIFITTNDKIINGETVPVKLNNLMDENYIDQIFVKPSDGLGGTDCFLYKKIKNGPMPVANNEMLHSNFIFQEVIKQHEIVNEVYPHSINTVRIYTLRDGNKISATSALMRFGAGGKNVDNASSGGFFVPIDIATGTLGRKGIQFLKHGGNTYEKHPDTGYVFNGFKIPQFDQVLSTSIEASGNLDNKMVAWDIAIGTDGIIFIEGNSNGSLLMAQIACGGFNNHPAYSTLLQ